MTRLLLEQLEPRDTPSLLASAGGLVLRLDPATGGVRHSWRPFEQSAAAVPLFLAEDADRVYVGAGTGGGPRLSAFDSETTAPLWSVYVGDPASRTGVSVSAFERATTPAPPKPSVQYLAGETPRVREFLAAVPPLALDLSRASVRVVPRDQWDRPGSVAAYYQGTGDRPVSGVLVIRAGDEWAAVHELGHAIDHLTGGLRAGEAAAEEYAWAFVRWVNGESNPTFDAIRGNPETWS